MQVKVCPKCRAENKAANAACSSCYTSLEGVAVTESAGPAPARTQAMPAAPKPPSAPAPTRQMPAAQQTQMGTMSPPPGMPPQSMQFQMGPPPRRSASPAIIALIIFLALAIFGGGLFVVVGKSGLFKPEAMPTEPPEKAVLSYLEAKKTHDISKVELYLCRKSIDMLDKAFSGRQVSSAGFGKKDAEEMYVFGAAPSLDQMANREMVANVLKGDEYEDDRTKVIRVVLDKKAAAAEAPQPLLPPGVTPPPKEEKQVDLSSLFDHGPIIAEFVVVAEDGHWKVDIGQGVNRNLGLGKPGNVFKPGK